MDQLVDILEHVKIGLVEFDVKLSYFYNEEYDYFYVDEELGNKNLQKIKDKYNELKCLE